jgi:hypothetical protein
VKFFGGCFELVGALKINHRPEQVAMILYGRDIGNELVAVPFDMLPHLRFT